MLVNLKSKGAVVEKFSTTVFKEEDVYVGKGKPLQEIGNVSFWVFICQWCCTLTRVRMLHGCADSRLFSRWKH